MDFACVLESMTVGLDIFLFKDDVSFRMDCFEETERERVFLETGNRERRPVTKGQRAAPFFNCGAKQGRLAQTTDAQASILDHIIVFTTGSEFSISGQKP